MLDENGVGIFFDMVQAYLVTSKSSDSIFSAKSTSSIYCFFDPLPGHSILPCSRVILPLKAIESALLEAL